MDQGLQLLLGHAASARLKRAQVEDTNPSATFTGQLTDYSGVDKFELTEEQYAARQGTYLLSLYCTLL